MKIAVIGNGPVGLEAGLEFFLEGADVRIIGRRSPACKIEILAERFPTLTCQGTQYISNNGQTILRESGESFDQTLLGEVTYFRLWNEYYLPIIKTLAKEGVFSQREVLRVQKRFCYPTEEIPNRSRLHDLFRLTYGVNPSGLVEEQVNENPELREKLSDEIMNSLKEQVESFEDFDLIFDCRGPFQRPIPMGAGHHFALNEQSVSSLGGIEYGTEAWANLDQIKGINLGKANQTITLVGGGAETAYTFLALTPWLREDSKRVLNIISSETEAFASLKNEQENILTTALEKEINFYRNRWSDECQRIELEIRDWKERPDYEKAKIPRPEFPDPQLRLYEGYSVVSVDRLMDREGLYLTLEIPPWRSSEKKEMVTVAQDAIISAVGHRRDERFFEGLQKGELGFFSFLSDDEGNDGWGTPSYALAMIPSVKSEILKYFSRA